jgi:hypothetical protein
MRREALQTIADSDSNVKKVRDKLNAVEDKYEIINKKEGNAEKYYNTEIERTKIKAEQDIQRFKEKCEQDIERYTQKINDKVNLYEDYCNSQISIIKNNAERVKDKITNKIDKCNEVIKNTIDEDNDRILVKLKLELTQLNKEVNESVLVYNDVYTRYEQNRNARNAELKRELQQQIALEERKEEDRKKALLLDIRTRKEKEKREEEERYNKRKEQELEKYYTAKETVIQSLVVDKPLTYTDHVKNFKMKYNNLLHDDKYKERSDYYDSKISIYETLLKTDLDRLIYLNDQQVKEYLDSNYDFYYLKFHFDQSLLSGTNSRYSKKEIDIYNNLNLLIKDECGYRKFFSITDAIKQHRFLKKLEKEYNHKLKEDEE